MELIFDYYFEKALDLMNNTNKSLFLTGKAGTGKSTLIKYFIENTSKKLLLLAPTGIAAINIGGSTIHSFFGFHPGINTEEIKSHFMSKDNLKVLQKADCIIIDEVSMLRADLFDIVDIFVKQVLKSDISMGGKQIIFVGDVYQLPPIIKQEEVNYFYNNYSTGFFFSSNAYISLSPETIELTNIHRQSDMIFKRVLNRIRNGIQTNRDLMYLNTRVKSDKQIPKGTINLVSTNKIASGINSYNLKQIDSQEFVAVAKISGDVPKGYYANDKIVRFKVGSQIMMVRNSEFSQNGTIGIVTGYDEEAEIASVQIHGEIHQIPFYEWNIRKPKYNKKSNLIEYEIVGTFKQLPFKLAWAVTIHKSQGMSFDAAFLDFGDRLFASGQAYVALSRLTRFDGLYLKRPLRKSDIILDSNIINFFGKTLLNQKIHQLDAAIGNKSKIRFYYLKRGVFIEYNQVCPLLVDEMIFDGISFFGLEGIVGNKNNSQIFSIENIFEIEII